MWIYQPNPTTPTQNNTLQPQQGCVPIFSTVGISDDAKEQDVLKTPQIRRNEKCKEIIENLPIKRATQGLHSVSVWILLFLAGMGTSGIFLRLCKKSQRQMILRGGQSWLDVFSNTPIQLFSTLFLTAALLLTILFMLGFCTFGKLFSKVVLFFYGVGIGVLCLQLFMMHGWRGWVFFAVIPGCYAVILACLLCRLSDAGGRVSAQLLNSLQKTENPPVRRGNGKALMDQYLVACSMQIVCCGVISAAARPVMGLLL